VAVSEPRSPSFYQSSSEEGLLTDHHARTIEQFVEEIEKLPFIDRAGTEFAFRDFARHLGGNFCPSVVSEMSDIGVPVEIKNLHFLRVRNRELTRGITITIYLVRIAERRSYSGYGYEDD
jgi:hypothetical protein